MKSIKTRIATVATAAAIATGGLIAAVPAQAQAAPGGIATGNYWYETFSYGVIPSGKVPARVANGRLIIYGAFGMKNVKRVHATPRGGYVDQDGFQRYLYRKVGKRSYTGNIMMGAVPVGHSWLTPRR